MRRYTFLERLPPLHRDPFDRLPRAHAHYEGLPVITPGPLIRQYPLRVIWWSIALAMLSDVLSELFREKLPSPVSSPVSFSWKGSPRFPVRKVFVNENHFEIWPLVRVQGGSDWRQHTVLPNPRIGAPRRELSL